LSTYAEQRACADVLSRLVSRIEGFRIRIQPKPPSDPRHLRKWINERAEYGLLEVDRRISKF
jgi:hypothetical protein